ncbi:MAG: DUF5676 family membrane protein [bacterium]
MPIQVVPFANALTGATALFYIVLWGLWLTAPKAFSFVYNSQFGGADVSSLYPPSMTPGALLATLSVVIVTAWVFGALWALLYNRLAR